jgi:hypothetical protein
VHNSLHANEQAQESEMSAITITPDRIGGITPQESFATRRAMSADDLAHAQYMLGQRLRDCADARTRAAVYEIGKLAAVLDELEVVNIISALIAAFSVSMNLRTSQYRGAVEDSLLDAVSLLETQK